MKKRGVVTLVLSVVIASFFLDKKLLSLISLLRSPALNEALLIFTAITSVLTMFAVLTLVFMYKKKQGQTIPLWIALFVESAVAAVLKFLIQRARPYQEGIIPTITALSSNAHFIWDFSMPSFHSMAAFSMIPFVLKEFPRLKYPAFIIAGLIGLARVYFGLHYLSDVLIGGIIGYSIGYFIIKRENKTKFGLKVWNKIFRH